MIPDDKSHFEVSGQTIRKGTVAAALANAEIIESIDVTAAEKQAAISQIRVALVSLIQQLLVLLNQQLQTMQPSGSY